MKLKYVVAALAISTGTAFAQTPPAQTPPAQRPAAQTPPAQSGPGNNAVSSPNTNNSAAPVSGANSFTEGQARSRIEVSGFTGISELRKDDNGVWRGKATRDGKSVNVSLDFQGNVNAN